MKLLIVYAYLVNSQFSIGDIMDTCTTVLPAKSDSDVMFCSQSYQGYLTDRSLVYLSYPEDRINMHVIYLFALGQVACTSECFTLSWHDTK